MKQESLFTDENAISVSENDDQEIVDFNEEIVSDDPVVKEDLESLVIYSRDWTIETIISQIEAGNIDLNPAFQRRNVWENDKRSKLIESLIVGYPVPEVVLAEIPGKKKQYVVIDGKQRLLAIHGFLDSSTEYWKGNAELKGLTIRKDLEGHTIQDFDSDDMRLLNNADLRCTILSGYNKTSVLYDVFYRLNTGSVPLSMQELRNSLHKGEFSKYLTNKTNNSIPLHEIMSLSGPDKRFKDIEILLKFLSINYSEKKYNSNLKDFLDSFTGFCNENWNIKHEEIKNACDLFDTSCTLLSEIFGRPKLVGRKWLPSKDNWETRFNRSLFEVLIQYIYLVVEQNQQTIFDQSKNKDIFVNSVKEAFNDPAFSSAVSATTKTLDQHRTRFASLFKIINEQLGFTFSIPESIK